MFSQRFLREIFSTAKLAGPISAMFVANMFMQVVDTYYVGKLGADALGGLSIGIAVFSTMMIVGMGLLLGLDFFVSKAFGEGDLDRCRHLLVQGSFIALAASAPLILAMHFAPLSFRWYGLSEPVIQNSVALLRTMSWSLIPFLLLSVFRMYLQGQGQPRAAFYVVIAANILNLVLNPLLVFGSLRMGIPPMGIHGSALATLIGRIFSFMMIAGFVFLPRNVRLQDFKGHLYLAWNTQRDLLRLGLPAAGQLLLEVGTFAGTTFMIGRLSSEQLAAHQIVLHIASFTFMVPLGISIAGAVRVGQALGRCHPRQAHAAGTSAIVLSAAVMLFFAAVLYGFGETFLSLFSHEAVVVNVGRKLLLIAVAFQLFDGIQITAAGVLRGSGDTRSSLIANFVGHWMLGFPLGAFLCLGPLHWGARGGWTGLSVGLMSVALMLLGVWSRRRLNIVRQPS